jgi:hypothetical protein
VWLDNLNTNLSRLAAVQLSLPIPPLLPVDFEHHDAFARNWLVHPYHKRSFAVHHRFVRSDVFAWNDTSEI